MRQFSLFQSVISKAIAVIGFGCLLLISGCSTHRQYDYQSSVMDYLYPDKNAKITPSIPHLKLPLQVGIAFVPHSQRDSHFTEQEKNDLLEKVATQFRSQPFIEHIEVIPSAYLRPRGGFMNLDQIKQMYDIDIIALVSYDQTQFQDSNALSLTYLTIVGSYLIPAEENATHTMIDTVVYDIDSRKLLFRAPGTHYSEGFSTPQNAEAKRRDARIAGVTKATEEMIINLQQAMNKFKTSIQEKPESVKISSSRNYSGGASFGLLGLLCLVGFYRQRRA